MWLTLISLGIRVTFEVLSRAAGTPASVAVRLSWQVKQLAKESIAWVKDSIEVLDMVSSPPVIEAGLSGPIPAGLTSTLSSLKVFSGRSYQMAPTRK
jgi:hypothetical protein